MSETNIFEQAARKKLRFSSPKGLLMVEQLWDLPLIGGTHGLDLNSLAIGINKQIRELGDESFVETAKPSSAKKGLELALNLLKHIIGVKQEEQKARARRAEAADKRVRLAHALANREDEKIKNMSEQEILAELKKLDDEIDEAA